MTPCLRMQPNIAAASDFPKNLQCFPDYGFSDTQTFQCKTDEPFRQLHYDIFIRNAFVEQLFSPLLYCTFTCNRLR